MGPDRKLLNGELGERLEEEEGVLQVGDEGEMVVDREPPHFIAVGCFGQARGLGDIDHKVDFPV